MKPDVVILKNPPHHHFLFTTTNRYQLPSNSQHISFDRSRLRVVNDIRFKVASKFLSRSKVTILFVSHTILAYSFSPSINKISSKNTLIILPFALTLKKLGASFFCEKAA